MRSPARALAILTVLAAGAPAAGAPSAGTPAPRTEAIARDVVAGRTGVWLLSQLTRVQGTALTGIGARIERVDPASGRTLARIDLPVSPESLVQGPSGTLWVTGSRLVRIDPRTRAHRFVGGSCASLLTEGRPAVWSASACTRTLTRRAHGGRPVLTGALAGSAPLAISVGADGLFLTRPRPSVLERRDPRDGRLLGRMRVGASPDELALRGGSVWVLASGPGVLDRIDPVTLRRSARIRLPFRGAGGSHLAVGGGAAWVIDQYRGRIARIDLRTERPRVRRLGPVPGGTLPIAVAPGPGAVWVVVQSDGTRSALCRLDPANGSVERCFARSR